MARFGGPTRRSLVLSAVLAAATLASLFEPMASSLASPIGALAIVWTGAALGGLALGWAWLRVYPAAYAAGSALLAASLVPGPGTLSAAFLFLVFAWVLGLSLIVPLAAGGAAIRELVTDTVALLRDRRRRGRQSDAPTRDAGPSAVP